MENASKALIIAGSILIAIVIIGLGVGIARMMSDSVTSNTNFTEQQISEFNAKINPYLGKHVSGSQVNALIQTVRSINQKVMTEDGTDTGIIDITYEVGSLSKENKFTDKQKVETGGKFYEVQETYDENSGLITSISVTLNK